jgi:hypothetical protein
MKQFPRRGGFGLRAPTRDRKDCPLKLPTQARDGSSGQPIAGNVADACLRYRRRAAMNTDRAAGAADELRQSRIAKSQCKS